MFELFDILTAHIADKNKCLELIADNIHNEIKMEFVDNSCTDHEIIESGHSLG